MPNTVLRFACVGCGKVFEQDLALPENNIAEELLHRCPDECRPVAEAELAEGLSPFGNRFLDLTSR